MRHFIDRFVLTYLAPAKDAVAVVVAGILLTMFVASPIMLYREFGTALGAALAAGVLMQLAAMLALLIFRGGAALGAPFFYLAGFAYYGLPRGDAIFLPDPVLHAVLYYSGGQMVAVVMGYLVLRFLTTFRADDDFRCRRADVLAAEGDFPTALQYIRSTAFLLNEEFLRKELALTAKLHGFGALRINHTLLADPSAPDPRLLGSLAVGLLEDAVRYATQVTERGQAPESVIQHAGLVPAVALYLGLLSGKGVPADGALARRFKAAICDYVRTNARAKLGYWPAYDAYTPLEMLQRILSPQYNWPLVCQFRDEAPFDFELDFSATGYIASGTVH